MTATSRATFFTKTNLYILDLPRSHSPEQSVREAVAVHEVTCDKVFGSAVASSLQEWDQVFVAIFLIVLEKSEISENQSITRLHQGQLGRVVKAIAC